MNFSRIPLLPIISAMLRNKTTALIIVAQIALTLAIVSNALYIAQQRIALIERDTGLPESELFVVEIKPPKNEVNPLRDMQALRSIPGVESVSASNAVPLSGSGSFTTFQLSADDSPDNVSINAGLFYTDHHFVDVTKLEIVAGRNFKAEEIGYANNKAEHMNHNIVVIVTQSFADKLFPNGEAVGKSIYQGGGPLKVIGVVKKLHGHNPRRKNAEQTILFNDVLLYRPLKYLVRTASLGMQDVMKQAKDKLRKENPQAIVMQPIRMSVMKKNYYSGDYLLRNVLLILVGALLLITGLGIIGMTLFNINRRIKQIGTRRALGASKSDVVIHFMLENLVVLSAGIIVGIVLALGLNSELASYFGVEKLPMSQLLYTLVVILVVGQVATFWPAMRAANISPAIATRHS